MGKLCEFSGKILIDPEYYIEQKRGLYTFQWREDERYALYFGGLDLFLDAIPEDYLKTKTTKHSEWENQQSLSINLANQPTTVPPEVYAKLSSALEQYEFQKENAFYSRICLGLFRVLFPFRPIQAPLEFSLNLINENSELIPSEYIVYDGDTCTVEVIEVKTPN
uniref:AlNc14C124G6775 protein n=1 Tax=Albugo laibachii Nc14 TaxID=890382 RepID=F0WJP9_9STRA|nr:AlNc14C124G6775 [Albugo laibachii Nc14]|eukprot:CCA21500.1 AlNc14C124G6775 [Albugo laibachii Nc14]